MTVIDGSACRASLATLEAGIRNNATQALATAVKEATKHATSTTLYNNRTGQLRANTTGTFFRLEGQLIANTPYAKFVEEGTSRQAERPFMQQARDFGEQVLSYGLEYFTDEAIKRAR